MNENGRLPPRRTRWHDFAVQVQKDAKLWTFLLALLVAVRGALVAAHLGQLDSATDAGVLLAAFASGVRYDYQVATWVTLPALLMSVVGSSTAWTDLADRVRFWLGAPAVALSVVIGGIDIGYIGEYGNQFDHFLLGVVFDDFRAIVTTIWASYPVVWGIMGMAGLVARPVWLLHPGARPPLRGPPLGRPAPPPPHPLRARGAAAPCVPAHHGELRCLAVRGALSVLGADRGCARTGPRGDPGDTLRAGVDRHHVLPQRPPPRPAGRGRIHRLPARGAPTLPLVAGGDLQTARLPHARVLLRLLELAPHRRLLRLAGL